MLQNIATLIKANKPMKIYVVLAFIAIFSTTAACGPLDDGVPRVSDPYNPKDEAGVTMAPQDFLIKYCGHFSERPKGDNAQCRKVWDKMPQL